MSDTVERPARAPLHAGLLIRTGQDGLWLGPAWAALCGAIAGNAFSWQGVDALRLALLLLLVEGGWATLWAAACDEDWLPALETWRAWQGRAPVPELPYTLPASPAARIARRLGELRDWWRREARPAHGPALASLALGAVLSLLVAAGLGARVLLLSLAAMAVVQLAFLFSPAGGEANRGAQGVVQAGLPWLAGALVFGQLSLTSALLALGFSAAYTGLLHVAQAGDRPPAPRERQAQGVDSAALLLLGPLFVAMLLAGTLRALPAMLAGLMIFPMAVLLVWRRPLGGPRVARYAQWPLMLAMLVAAAVMAP